MSREDEKGTVPADGAAMGTLPQGWFLESTKVQDGRTCYLLPGFLKCFKSGRPQSDRENITECKKVKGVETPFQHLSPWGQKKDRPSSQLTSSGRSQHLGPQAGKAADLYRLSPRGLGTRKASHSGWHKLTSTELGQGTSPATRETGRQHRAVTAKPMTLRNATVRRLP